nr:unnamed protein product [Callosobruchus analis]
MERFPQVYNFSANRSKLLVPMNNFADFTKLEYIHFKAAIWYQVLFLVKTKYIYEILKFLVQTIPAYLFQPLLSLARYKMSLKKINTKLNRVASVLSYFLLNEWDIENKNIFDLWQKLNTNDRELFRFDLGSIETVSYYTNLMNGLKKYTLKEDISEYRSRRQTNKRLDKLYSLIRF